MPAQTLIVDKETGARLMQRATLLAVAAGVFLTLLKAGAWTQTGSVAMLAALFDSLVDAIASFINFLAVRHALTPADAEHRFGHGKAEALAGLGQSFFILASAGFILFEAISRLIAPQPVEAALAGIVVAAIAILVTIALVLYQRHVIARTGSLAISADSLHYSGDLLMNAAVIGALLLGSFAGIGWADPVFGIAIACTIIVSAWRIVRGALDQLMDRELSDEDREAIRTLALSHEGVVDIHELRTRSSGIHVFIQLHLDLDPGLSFIRAHQISDLVEKQIMAKFPGSEVLIHQDPAGYDGPRPTPPE
ncbi:MAG: cation diffusion facilitator family transporter [Parvibaculaceae bacterium]|nr:cation diffusion facilitator family transporter [Parvibaculaceae bacterium]